MLIPFITWLCWFAFTIKSVILLRLMVSLQYLNHHLVFIYHLETKIRESLFKLWHFVLNWQKNNLGYSHSELRILESNLPKAIQLYFGFYTFVLTTCRYIFKVYSTQYILPSPPPVSPFRYNVFETASIL